MKKYIFFLILWIWCIPLYSAYTPTLMYKKPVMVFSTQNEAVFEKAKKIFPEKFEFLCRSDAWETSEVLDFVCMEFEAGFGCGVTQRKNDQYFLWTCKLTEKSTEKIFFQKRFQVYKQREEILAKNYPTQYDLTSDFPKKSIQGKAMSCESSAASDILSRMMNKQITEDDVITILSKSWYNQTAIQKNGKRYWGDPEKWFVWYIDKDMKNDITAKQWKYEGYGVYEAPIAEVFEYYGFQSEILNVYNQKKEWFATPLKHLSYLLQQITLWNSVELWGDICTYPSEEDGNYGGKMTTKKANEWKVWVNRCSDPEKPRILSWYSVDETGNERQIKALNWQHAFYLLGYEWSITNPNYIIVWDTATGRHKYTTKEWMRKWERMEYRSLVIFKK